MPVGKPKVTKRPESEEEKLNNSVTLREILHLRDSVSRSKTEFFHRDVDASLKHRTFTDINNKSEPPRTIHATEEGCGRWAVV